MSNKFLDLIRLRDDQLSLSLSNAVFRETLKASLLTEIDAKHCNDLLLSLPAPSPRSGYNGSHSGKDGTYPWTLLSELEP